MLGRLMVRCAACVVLVACGVLAGAQPLADRVPGDALMYVAWGGAEKVGPGYAGSHLEGILGESEIPKLFNETLPEFLQTLAQKQPQVAQVAGMVSAIGGPLWRHPSAFYFGGYDLTDKQKPLPRFAILCDAGAEGAQFAALMQKLVQSTHPPYDIKVEEAGGLVAIHSGIAGYSAQAKPADALPGAKAFQGALAQVGKDPVLAVYVDVEGMLKLMDAMVPPGPGAANWAKVRDAIGLTSVKRAILTAGFDGKDWASYAFVDAPAPRQGVVAQLLSAKPLDDDFYKAIPDSALLAVGGRFDLGGLLNAVRAAIVQAEPRAGDAIDGGLAQVRDAIGVDVQKDLLDVLGDQWGFYIDGQGGGTGMMGTVLFNKPRDAAKLEATVTKLEDVGNALLKKNRGPDGPVFEIRRSMARGLNLHYLPMPLVTPTWAIRDGVWLAGLSPQAVVGAGEQVAAKGKSIRDNPEFATLQKRLGGHPVVSFGFADLPRSAADSYGQMLLMSRLFLGMGDLFGAKVPPLVLPTLKQVLPHLSVAGSASWIDDAGWHMRGLEPFPGSAMLTSGGGAQMIVGSQALTMSILLPSLNKAREKANQVKCGSNLRQIGQGIMLYANDHKGMFPPDLGTMMLEVDMTPDVFVCPSANSVAPPRPAAPANAAGLAQWQKESVQWVNANADYVYLGAGKKNTTPADVAVCYEKPDNHHAQGMNVLFGDGHVEWMMMPDAMREVDRAKQAGGKAGGI